MAYPVRHYGYLPRARLRAAVVYVEPLFRAAGLVVEVAPKMSVVAIAQKGCQAEAWRYMGKTSPRRIACVMRYGFSGFFVGAQHAVPGQSAWQGRAI